MQIWHDVGASKGSAQSPIVRRQLANLQDVGLPLGDHNDDDDNDDDDNDDDDLQNVICCVLKRSWVKRFPTKVLYPSQNKDHTCYD